MMKNRIKDDLLTMQEHDEFNNDILSHLQMSTNDIINTLNQSDVLFQNYNDDIEPFGGTGLEYLTNSVPNGNCSLLHHLNSDINSDFHFPNVNQTAICGSEPIQFRNFSILNPGYPNYKFSDGFQVYSANLFQQMPQHAHMGIGDPSSSLKLHHNGGLGHPSNSPLLLEGSNKVVGNKERRMRMTTAATEAGSMKLISADGDKSFACGQCSSRFTRKDELRRHEKIHSGIRTLTCPYCDKSFIRSDHRTTHIRTHTGEKPYRCDLCAKCFARSDERTRHRKVHLKDGGRKTGNKLHKLPKTLLKKEVGVNVTMFEHSINRQISDLHSSSSSTVPSN